ncbi:hypothetical protein E2C01_066554 [Portunus trituberculatus]|uniref:Uncharacterized protein n=1 Tax=Portunus trituberculatus TaxID=210409 RepID=A0A5B7HQT4_PORTR|nr:hypothetical protein [Portunus trituberculatus]
MADRHFFRQYGGLRRVWRLGKSRPLHDVRARGREGAGPRRPLPVGDSLQGWVWPTYRAAWKDAAPASVLSGDYSEEEKHRLSRAGDTYIITTWPWLHLNTGVERHVG